MTIKGLAFVVMFAMALAMYAWAQTPPPAPDVKSGPDIGFRLERVEGGRAIGRLVVRVDGKWLEAGSPAKIVPLHTK